MSSSETARARGLSPTVWLGDYDWVLVNTSAGKDSQTMIRRVVEQATLEGVLDRLVAVHCDLGRVEWKGTAELAELQALHYGLRFIKVSRPQGDLLTHVEQHGKWPGPDTRFCTSDHKRGQVRKVMTALVKELDLGGSRKPTRPAKILNCIGIRASESKARSKLERFSYDRSASGKGTVRQVWTWHPIFDMSLDEVWSDIRAHEVPHHFAYDLGMPRLSCCFCIYASPEALVLAAQHNPELADEYVRVELKIGHTLKSNLSMETVVERAKTEVVTNVSTWEM